jgi:hypothetical protein
MILRKGGLLKACFKLFFCKKKTHSFACKILKSFFRAEKKEEKTICILAEFCLKFISSSEFMFDMSMGAVVVVLTTSSMDTSSTSSSM